MSYFLNRQQFSYTLAEAEEHKLKSEKVIESLQQEIQELQSKLNNATNSSPEEVCFFVLIMLYFMWIQF